MTKIQVIRTCAFWPTVLLELLSYSTPPPLVKIASCCHCLDIHKTWLNLDCHSPQCKLVSFCLASGQCKIDDSLVYSVSNISVVQAVVLANSFLHLSAFIRLKTLSFLFETRELHTNVRGVIRLLNNFQLSCQPVHGPLGTRHDSRTSSPLTMLYVRVAEP